MLHHLPQLSHVNIYSRDPDLEKLSWNDTLKLLINPTPSKFY